MPAIPKNLMVLTDRSGKIVFVPPEVESWSGYSVSESIGQKPGRLWGGNMDAGFYDGFWKRLTSERQPFSTFLENQTKSGKALPSLLGVLPILESGDLKYFLAVQPERSGWSYFEKEFRKQAGRLMVDPAALSAWLSYWGIGAPRFQDKLSLGEWLEQEFVMPLRKRFDYRAEDQYLVAKAKQCQDGYAELFEKYYKLIVSYLARRLPESIEAEDVAQEVFLKALGRLSSFESMNASYKTYLLRIAHNELLNRYRRQELENRPKHDGGYEVDELAELERRDLLERALSRLSIRDQAILKAFYLGSKTVHEIAKDVGISENAVKLTLSRSRKRLRQYL